MCAKLQICIIKTVREDVSTKFVSRKRITRHENLHGKLSLCAENLIRSIGQKLTFRLKCSQLAIQR